VWSNPFEACQAQQSATFQEAGGYLKPDNSVGASRLIEKMLLAPRKIDLSPPLWYTSALMAAKKLQGQVAIITGASRGIGRAAAERIARAGASVVLVARDAEQLETAVDELSRQGLEAIGVEADVADIEQVEAVIETTLEQFKRIDILVNSAAVVWPLDEVAEADPDEWAYSIQVNLVGPFTVARAVLPVMLTQGYGRILNISSAAASHPIAGASAYCASKAGLDMFTRTLALELHEQPVQVVGLDPGMVDTDMQADVRSVDTSESGLDFSFWHQCHEDGKLLPATEIARWILWLVGPWNRNNNEFFTVSDPVWIEQVRQDIGE
jgi:NAD(P)-dependent dehydrogenase (short-subunit alcohol dehydrogenase family)